LEEKMKAIPETHRMTDRSGDRTLVVADWSLDPVLVVEAIRDRGRAGQETFGLLVPARLHGIDWAGDPHASRPCAERQRLALERLCRDAGITLETGRVGDPEPAAAIGDVLLDWPAGQILLLGRERGVRASHPFSLARRVRRRTGLPVIARSLPDVPAPPFARRRFRRPTCADPRLRPAWR
jgi:hypothetical protein